MLFKLTLYYGRILIAIATFDVPWDLYTHNMHTILIKCTAVQAYT